ncbi:glycosyltransferase [Microbacterium hominis]|uniref:GDSL-type esterase/lipase family protein n=1 Tax=Microbacterium TaxID=33882 RepID=UPI00168B79D5|nr:MULTISPECIES: GDSL-type esterase/lipase family protein [Microbacterium]QOC25928.1 glycosyltransferase [Microbacterium hominis]QOC29906.1 glycosyltransferase [Microbacterium hominis]QYF97699.1 glycosyltransferase [Microbacterium sp. PAMC21962]
MRVAFVAESFLPHMNGVTGSVLQSVRHLTARGHDALVIAPGAPGARSDATTTLLPSVPLPAYRQVRIALGRTGTLAGILRDYAPDVVHLASPFVLGWRAVAAAEALELPTVAVYQTDVIAYARKYGVPRATALTAAHVARLHGRATLTLAPSSSALRQLDELGVDRTRLWGRGVDTQRFRPEHRSEAWRSWIAPGEVIVGYVGRLAPEKQVEDLAVLADIPGVRLVIVGDGPARARLERALPRAVFLGHLAGAELAQAMAGFDVFVHPGESETFGQTIQEAHASGVPVVATGRGGPVDLVRSSVDGWLYRPGDLDDLRDRVRDLVGDATKRQAFGAAARAGVEGRTWPALVDTLEQYYLEARRLHGAERGTRVGSTSAPAAERPAPPPRGWSRIIALGDSLTEGLCDTSRMPEGEYRGWADRLATLLAQRSPTPVRYANLAVRSRRVGDLLDEQLPRALAMRPELATVLIGANDLVSHHVDADTVAARVDDAVGRLRAAGSDVLLVTPFLPDRRASRLFSRRFARFAVRLREIAARHGAFLLDLESDPDIGEREKWAHDKVHLSSRGHRFVAYRSAEVLGLPDVEALGALDAALHADDDRPVSGTWLTRDALPWAWRRLRGRTAGDAVTAKHTDYVDLPAGGSSDRARTPQR